MGVFQQMLMFNLLLGYKHLPQVSTIVVRYCYVYIIK